MPHKSAVHISHASLELEYIYYKVEVWDDSKIMMTGSTFKQSVNLSAAILSPQTFLKC